MRKRLTALLLALFLCIVSFVQLTAAAVSGSDAAKGAVSGSDASGSDISGSDASDSDAELSYADIQQPMRGLDAKQVCEEINLGWCLGEALDSWESSAGYDSFYNSNAYQMIIRYDDKKGYRSVSIANTFKDDNTCTFKWETGLIESDPMEDVGDIGFEIWNLAFEENTTITVKCTEAHLVRRNNQEVDIEDLLGEHEVTISKYGTGAVLTDVFPKGIEHTKGITDGTLKITVELVDFPQKTYSKEQFFETLWNNPLTTREMITAVKERGFNAVRIPVTYFNHTVKDTYEVDAAWLDRIQEVADYVISQDMYCIIDMHNDGSTGGWLRVSPKPTTSGTDAQTESENVRKRFAAIWKQVAEKFRNYDDRLLLQDCNELTNSASQWDYPGETDIEWMNDLNQLFVNTVRATGSNNETRCLLVAPYSGAYEASVIQGFRLPKDTVENKLIAAVNCFYPADFSWTLASDNDTSYTDVVDWGSNEDMADMDKLFEDMKATFIDQGIPLCIVAFGSDDKGNTQARVEHARHFVKDASQYGIPCFWWDDGSLLMRREGTWTCEELVEAMVDTTSIHVDNLDVEILGDCWFTGQPVTPEIGLTLKGYEIKGGYTVVSTADGGTQRIPDGRSVTDRIREYGLPPYNERSTAAETLVQDEDYTVSYENNVGVGTARMYITGRGKFSGIRMVEFKIKEEPSAVVNLLSLGSDNPDMPLVVMLSVPMLMLLGGIAVYKTVQRRESERVEAVIAATLPGYEGGDDDGYDDEGYEDEPRGGGRKGREPDPPAERARSGYDDDFYDDYDDAGSESGYDDDF